MDAARPFSMSKDVLEMSNVERKEDISVSLDFFVPNKLKMVTLRVKTFYLGALSQVMVGIPTPLIYSVFQNGLPSFKILPPGGSMSAGADIEVKTIQCFSYFCFKPAEVQPNVGSNVVENKSNACHGYPGNRFAVLIVKTGH